MTNTKAIKELEDEVKAGVEAFLELPKEERMKLISKAYSLKLLKKYGPKLKA